MKTIIWLLVIIGWSVLQARKKAMRERERQKRATSAPEPPSPAYQRTEVPRKLDAIMQYARSRTQSEANVRSVESMQPDAAMQDEEKVTEIVPQPEETEYAAQNDIRSRFSPNSLRTFFVMREVLGPPRAKKRFHARLKAQE